MSRAHAMPDVWRCCAHHALPASGKDRGTDIDHAFRTPLTPAFPRWERAFEKVGEDLQNGRAAHRIPPAGQRLAGGAPLPEKPSPLCCSSRW